MRHTCKSKQGAAMLLCVFMTAAFLGAITMLSVRTVAHVRHSQYAAWRVSADASAELVLELAELGYLSGEAPKQVPVTGDARLPRVDDPRIARQQLEGVPEMSYYLLSDTVDGQEEVRYRIAVAEVEGVHSAVEALYRRQGEAWVRLTWRLRRVNSAGDTP